VQGDYWHGNPKIYTELNLVQNNIKEKDKLKAEFAISHGFKLFYIWETEINNNDFTVLDKIKDIINEISTCTDN
jgi:very-short-patch-repair endonuclease